MAIIHLCRNAINNTGGLEAFIKSCSEYQLNSGEQVFVFDRGVNFSSIKELVKTIKAFRNSHIYIHDPQLIYILLPVRLTFLLLNIRNAKLLLVTHGFFFHNGSLFKSFFGSMILRLTILADVVLATSGEDFERSQNRNTILIGNGFDRRELTSCKIHSNKFLMVSRDVPHKNLIEGIDIFRQLLLVFSNIRLTIVCKNPSDQLKLETSILDSVDLLTEVNGEELIRLYQESSFLIAPSKYEGFGRTLIEAAIWGCIPIYRSNYGHEYIRSEINKFNGFELGHCYNELEKQQGYIELVEFLRRRFDSLDLMRHDSDLTRLSVEPFFWDQIFLKIKNGIKEFCDE